MTDPQSPGSPPSLREALEEAVCECGHPAALHAEKRCYGSAGTRARWIAEPSTDRCGCLEWRKPRVLLAAGDTPRETQEPRPKEWECVCGHHYNKHGERVPGNSFFHCSICDCKGYVDGPATNELVKAAPPRAGETPEACVYYGHALDLVADELDTLQPDRLDIRRDKLIAVIRTASRWMRRDDAEAAFSPIGETNDSAKAD